MIESTAYLPFVRKGWIKVNGDRRLKVGNICRHKATGEIFSIDHVQQHYSISDGTIERYTTIQVSRGMIEQLIYGVPLADATTGQPASFISYFNIVNTSIPNVYNTVSKTIEQQVVTGTTTISPLSNGPVIVPSLSFNYSSDISTIMGAGNQGIDLLETYSSDERGKFVMLINALNAANYKVLVKAGKYTSTNQKALWKGTANDASHGRHEGGMSIDINLISETGGVISSGSLMTDWLATGAVDIARQIGFLWGGSDFPGFYNVEHFEYSVGTGTSGNAQSFTQNTYKTTQRVTQNKTIDIAKVFGKIKVNPDVFQYFLSKRQFKEAYNNSKQVFFERNGELQVQLPDHTIKSSK